MDKTRRKLVLSLIAFFSSLVVIIISALSMEGSPSEAQLIGLIAGSFAAGAAFVNAIRDYTGSRQSGARRAIGQPEGDRANEGATATTAVQEREGLAQEDPIRPA